jgi:hypothetical protein
MKQFTIGFDFEGRNYEADVTEIGGLDDVQYAVSPKDEKLAERFKTNVLRRVKGEPNFQYSFPETSGSDEFMESLSKGLEAYLTGH